MTHSGMFTSAIAALRRKLDEVIADAAGKSVEEVAGDTERDCWLTAEEARSYGLVSRIVTTKAEI